MSRIALLVLSAALLVAAAPARPTTGVRGPEPDDAQGSAQLNRHVDAHLPARAGESAPDAEAPRRRPARDPFRGSLDSPPPPLPLPQDRIRRR